MLHRESSHWIIIHANQYIKYDVDHFPTYAKFQDATLLGIIT